MKIKWYVNRLRKMGPAEIAKRFIEHAVIYYSKIKYRDYGQWPYKRFSKKAGKISLFQMPAPSGAKPVISFQIYYDTADLSKPIDWYFSDTQNQKWPRIFYNDINYRPGNPFGDVRINWELNRLQFLPHLTLCNEQRAKDILIDWLDNNPFLQGPAYISSMELALRWISIYRTICIMKTPPDENLMRSLAGLAHASGKFILSRLSTHSSAGNHLIVESVGLFWIAQALCDSSDAIRWRRIARKLLWEQIPAQIHPDGSPKEQSFWYLGFVLDAVCHYLLIEDKDVIPETFLNRVEKAFEFVDCMVTDSGNFPDFGDRDDGYVLRDDNDYSGSQFFRLLTVGGNYFNRSEWIRGHSHDQGWFQFSNGNKKETIFDKHASEEITGEKPPSMKTYPDGGMTLMKRGEGRLLFRHSHLGLGNTCGHGHADALAILFSWKKTPVLIDVGSGQYNGSQEVRNYFRSTIAHNTIEIGKKNQAEIVGPFLWKESYNTKILSSGKIQGLFVEAEHDGYFRDFSVIHRRKVEWNDDRKIIITDSLHGKGEHQITGAFHLGRCKGVKVCNSEVLADFDKFHFIMNFPTGFKIRIERGAEKPFRGWCSTIYGRWAPINMVIYTDSIKSGQSYQIELSIK